MKVTYKSSLPQRSERLRVGVPIVVAKAAREVQGLAIENTDLHDLVDTGKMVGSWRAKIQTSTRWIVTNITEYAIHWEFGHNNIFTRRYEKAKPMLRPAVEDVFPRFSAAIARLLK